MRHRFIMLIAVAAAGLVVPGLVYAVLVAAGAAEPAAATVQGVTARRLWASIVLMLALIGVVISGFALARPSDSAASGSRATVGVGLGLAGLLNGVLNLALATGGPGSGNGVVGAAAAVVLGLVAVALGWLVLARGRRAAAMPRDMNSAA
jgi:hypothetical protein